MWVERLQKQRIAFYPRSPALRHSSWFLIQPHYTIPHGTKATTESIDFSRLAVGFWDERDVANGTVPPLSNRLSSLCTVGEQMESEFSLDLEHRSAPDLIGLTAGGRNRQTRDQDLAGLGHYD